MIKAKRTYDIYIFLENDVPKKMKIFGWEFPKNGADDVLFKCSVAEENGVAVDKFWTVWDHDLKELLKKKLKPFNAKKSRVDLIVTRRGDEIEESFELELLSKSPKKA